MYIHISEFNFFLVNSALTALGPLVSTELIPEGLE